MLPTPEFISTFIERQFPLFYRLEGQNFVAFIKAYYEWMEETGQLTNKTRNLFSTRDIDDTAEQFVENFRNKYMKGIPKEIAGDKRFLQKHILDVYRSKGSIDGLQLFFRLLYNEEVKVYIPSVDILKASDGAWIENKYIEVTHTDYNSSFVNQMIIGSASGASALLESYNRQFTSDKIVNVFYISNIQGVFLVGERVAIEGFDYDLAPKILGSPTSLNIIGSSIEHNVGDVIIPQDSEGSGVGLKAIITSTRIAGSSNGTIDFRIIDGGLGYTENANIIITTGSNSSGSGATFTGYTLTDVASFSYSISYINAVASTILNAGTYGPTLNNATLATILNDALTTNTTNIGTISALTGINPGDGYDGYINIRIQDPIIGPYNFSDGNGGVLGNNAVIHGNVVLGVGIANGTLVKNSGFGYHTALESVVTYNSTQGDTNKVVNVTLNLSGVGTQEGYWDNTRGFLSSDKYIQDSYYYQEYSYETRISKSFDKYFDILKQVVHPAGNKAFGRTFILSTDVENELSFDADSFVEKV